MLTITDLQKIVKTIDNPTTRTVEALLVDVCDGNEAAARMLHQLLYWWRGRSVDVYKSHADWHAELRLTRSRVDRAVTKLKDFVTITVRKAYGTPTRHFRLNTLAFISRIAAALNTTADAIKHIIAPQSVQPIASQSCNAMPQNDAMDCIKMTQSTNNNTNNNTDNNKKQQAINTTALKQSQPAVAAAEKFNFDPEIVKVFGETAPHIVGQYGQNRVLEVISHTASREDIKNPAGFARYVLATGGTLKPLAPPAADTDDPMRFVRGEFADFIDH